MVAWGPRKLFTGLLAHAASGRRHAFTHTINGSSSALVGLAPMCSTFRFQLRPK